MIRFVYLDGKQMHICENVHGPIGAGKSISLKGQLEVLKARSNVMAMS